MNPRTALIVAIVALVVGAAGLVFGITAKNSSDDAKDASEQTQARLEPAAELNGVEAAEL